MTTDAYRRLTGKDAPPPDPVRYSNTRVAALMSLFLNFFASSVTPDQLEDIASSCRVERTEAYAECVAALCGVGTDSAERAFTQRYLRNMIRELDVTEFQNDPYYRTVRIPEAAAGRFVLTTMELPACEGFVRDDFVVENDGRMLPQIGYFTEPYRYPAVLEDGREWMTLLPNETVSTLPAVRNAHGRVLTYGLGLGYFAFMASRKANVESVTVVERDPDLIDLFRAYVLPQFPDRHKVEILCADAFAFAEQLRPGDPYDYVFADIWHDAGDGREMYLRFKSLEKNLPDAGFDYWLEKTILCYIAKELWAPV